MKMRHVSSVGVSSLPSQQSCSSSTASWAPPPSSQQGGAGDTLDLDVPVLAGAPSSQQQSLQGLERGAEAPPPGSGAAAGMQPASGPGPGPSSGPRQAFVMKRLTRGDNRRYHTAGTVDDVKV